MRPIVVAAAQGVFTTLEPLLAVYRGERPVHLHPVEGALPGHDELTALACGAEGLLVVGPRRRSPRTVLPGPVLRTGDGRAVPAGWLPDVGPGPLGRFARAAAAVHRRSHAATVAVLGQRSRRYRHLADRIKRLLVECSHPAPVLSWTADELVLPDLVRGLGYGPGIAVYVGHGRPTGWAGYRGVRAHHLDQLAEPVGAVLSLTCLTASRRRIGLSFAEALPLQGAAAAVLAAVDETNHLANARWALRLVGAAGAGTDTLGELVAAAPPEADAGTYRIIGDPLALLADAPGAAEQSLQMTRETGLDEGVIG